MQETKYKKGEYKIVKSYVGDEKEQQLKKWKKKYKMSGVEWKRAEQ